MGFDSEIKNVVDKIQVFDKMYEEMRLVDPVSKKVVAFGNSGYVEQESINCYAFWSKGKVCDNCISMRAYHENQTFVKIEYAADKIYMITAIPHELGERRIVIELFKDVTGSMVFGSGNYENTSSAIYAMIDNLNNLVLKDPLTGLYNRRYINEKLPIDLANAALSEQSLSVIMADIDFFKQVNDTYGHLVGDCVLKSFAELLAESVQRESDWVSRYGGEEFLLCFPGASVERTVEIAENIRKNLEKSDIVCGEHKIGITASFGVCSIHPSEGEKIEKLIECADKKLYDAKNNGRNRVEA